LLYIRALSDASLLPFLNFQLRQGNGKLLGLGIRRTEGRLAVACEMNSPLEGGEAMQAI